MASAAVGDVFVSGNYKYQITTEATSTEVSGAGEATLLGFSTTASAADQANAAIAQYFQKDGKMYIVTAIAPNAFSNNTNITSVSIKGAVAKVGMSAFYGCSNLTKVSLGSVTTLDNYAFAFCTSLTSVKIPDTLTSINNSAFDGCTALESYVVSESNTNYSSYDGALYNKKQTTLVRMPAAKAEKPAYPNTLKTIFARAYNNYKYPRIEIPYGVTTVGSRPFENSEVQVVVVPSSVQTIPTDMFYGCSKLIELWSNMQNPPSIEKDVMFAGANIPKLYFPFDGENKYTKESNWNFFPKLSMYGPFAYDYIQARDEYGTNACFNVTVHSTEPFTANDGVTYDGRCMLVKGPSSMNKSDDITVPNYFEISGKKYALTRIGEYAGQSQYNFSMRGCALIDTIGYSAFYGSPISSFNFENVSYIEYTSFSHCNQLKTVQFGPKLKSISDMAFLESGLEGDVVIPYGVGKFSVDVFHRTNIKRLLLPSTISFVGWESFSMPELEELYINIKTRDRIGSLLEDYPAGCKVYVPIGEVDGYRAFESSKDKEILPGAFDFAECTSDDKSDFFTTPYAYSVVDAEAKTVKLVRTKNTATAAMKTFEVGAQCTNNSLACAPEDAPVYKIVELGDSLLAGCKNYNNISLEGAAHLSKIGNYALADVKASTITIPQNVFSIGNEAFSKDGGEYQWTTIDSKIPDPRNVAMGSDVFRGVDYKHCTLIVPQGTESLYRGLDQWKEFFPVAPNSTGEAKRNGNINVKWVQLWENGPKFAEYNVGAASATGSGGFYCWGKSFDQDPSEYYKEGTEPLSGSDDTATKLWGSNWRMPTKAEFEALLANCAAEWTTINNVSGRKFTGKGDYASCSIFLPAAGYCDYYAHGSDDFRGQNIMGRYWSSTPDGTSEAYDLFFYSGYQSLLIENRTNGYTVRAVLAEETAPVTKGDVNGDDVVDITDANILINILLGKDSASKYAGADVTGDGVVDIADVNAVLNIILGK